LRSCIPKPGLFPLLRRQRLLFGQGYRKKANVADTPYPEPWLRIYAAIVHPVITGRTNRAALWFMGKR
jgi:hypothetical protein